MNERERYYNPKLFDVKHLERSNVRRGRSGWLWSLIKGASVAVVAVSCWMLLEA